MHKASKPWLSKTPDTWLTRALSWLLTMGFVMTMWVFFRAATWHDAIVVIDTIFSDFSLDYVVPFAAARMLWLVFLILIIVAHALPAAFWTKAGNLFVRSPWAVKLIVFLAVVQLVIELRSEDVVPFIYFQF